MLFIRWIPGLNVIGFCINYDVRKTEMNEIDLERIVENHGGALVLITSLIIALIFLVVVVF